jgi:hypothetical protein
MHNTAKKKRRRRRRRKIASTCQDSETLSLRSVVVSTGLTLEKIAGIKQCGH